MLESESMRPQSFELFTERLRDKLENDPRVIGFVTLGTTADSELRDEWSDHDFWIITEAGAQNSYLTDFSWLPDAENIAITVRHGERYRSAVYRDRHKVEFAVLDVDEARDGKIERYGVLIDRGGVAELIESIRQQTFEQAQTSRTWADGLQNLCIIVWTACERFERGEMLSARQYIDGFAVNQLLQLVSVHTSDESDVSADLLDARRRLEMRSPELAAEVLRILTKPVPEAALGLLGIAERELKSKAPDLAWEEVALVQTWISELEGQ